MGFARCALAPLGPHHGTNHEETPPLHLDHLRASHSRRAFTLSHDWLTRALPKAHAEGLSPTAKHARRLAQIRMCRHRQKMAKLAALAAAHDGKLTTGMDGIARDILEVRSPILLDA